jgi:uncharacterized membrane protein
MTTPLLMLAILCLPMAVLALPWVRNRGYGHRTAAAVGLGLVFLFTVSGHFLRAAPMAEMIPPWVPARDLLVFLTGLLELAIAAGLFHPATRRLAGIAAAVVLVGFFPFNVYAATHHVPMGGPCLGAGLPVHPGAAPSRPAGLGLRVRDPAGTACGNRSLTFARGIRPLGARLGVGAGRAHPLEQARELDLGLAAQDLFPLDHGHELVDARIEAFVVLFEPFELFGLEPRRESPAVILRGALSGRAFDHVRTVVQDNPDPAAFLVTPYPATLEPHPDGVGADSQPHRGLLDC